MRKKRLVNVLTSAALTAALVMSMGMTAMADDPADTGTETEIETETGPGDSSTIGVITNGSGISSVTVGKTVTTDGNTYKPNTTFGFEVETGESGTFSDGANENLVVYAGISGGLKAETGAAFAPSSSDTLSTSYTGEGSLTVDASVFTHTGVYSYVVTETEGSYEGINYSEESYTVYLYVYQGTDESTGKTYYYVGNVVTVKNGEKADLKFTNDYGQTTDTTHDVTFTKKVSGTMADSDQSFVFDVSVNGGNGEYYKVVYSESSSSEAQTTNVQSGAAATAITIKATGYIKIYGLTENDTYSVVERDYTSEGYTTTYSDGEGGSGKATKDATEVIVTNTKDAITPTGIILDFAPYILLIAFAGVFAVLFLGKKRKNI